MHKQTNEQTNKQTNKQAKAEAMVQLGIALQRLIATMVYHHELDLPFLFSKLGIKYGLWRIFVSYKVLPSLTPVDSIDDIKLVVPTSLQIGWCKSLIYSDIAQKHLATSSQNQSI